MRNSRGLVGRCDAKCYNAENPKCDCICGGVNHGVGKVRGERNMEKYCDEWIKDHQSEEGFRMKGLVQQKHLF